MKTIDIKPILCCFALASSPLYAGEFVDWHDDGSATLKLGSAYDDVTIDVPAGAMGGLFGPNQKPFDGAEISVAVLGSGPKGGISGPLHAFRGAWEELTGGKLNVVEIPFGELYTKMMLDVRNGEGQFDAFMAGAFWYGDLVPAGFAFSIDELQASGDYPYWTYDSMPASLRALHTWDGQGYGVLNDADGQVLYYRKSALTDPAHQAEFVAKFGYDLPVPPTKWEQVRDIASYFNGKNWDKNDADPDSGMVLHLKVGEQGHYHFQSLSAPFAITPGDQLDRYHNVYWFDPETMAPMINSPGHVRALEFLQDLHKTGPGAQIGWSLGEAWDYFLRGKSVFAFSWGDLGALCQDEERSKVRGDCAATVLPGTQEYYDHEAKKFVAADGDNRVGNTTGGSWHGVISNYSANPEATYSLLSLMALEPVSAWSSKNGWTGVDPGYSYQMLEPLGSATLEEYAEAGWNGDDVQTYTSAYYENFNAETQLPYLRIPGTFEYWDILDKNLSAAMTGQLSAQEALDETAKSWELVTDRLGRNKQKEFYQAAIGYGEK